MARSSLPFHKEVKKASLLQWNARGLKSRISDFRHFVFENRFPILVICEPNVQNAIRISGYEAFMSSTCGDVSKVIVYIGCELTYVLHLIPPHDTNQYVCLIVKTKKLTFTLVAAYIAPSSRFDSKRLHDVLSTTPGPTILTGDFNAHHPLWGSLKIDSRRRRLASFVTQYDRHYLNDGSPTYL